MACKKERLHMAEDGGKQDALSLRRCRDIWGEHRLKGRESPSQRGGVQNTVVGLNTSIIRPPV